MEPVRLGIIGCGVIGSKHAEVSAASPLIDLTAVADLRSDVARDVASRFGAGKVYDSAEALLADPEVEAVVLALPACYRTQLAINAFAAGKHVLTEKPVAMSANEVRRLIAARGDRVAGCCSSRFQFLDSTRAVAEHIASGALGSLRLLRCRAIVPARPAPAVPPPAWRLNRSLNAGGIMSNWGCYDLDYLLGIAGWSLRPQLVLAQTWTVPPVYASHVAPGSDAETHVAALIRCADGVAITYERGEYVAARAEASWEAIGDRGSLTLRMTPAEDKTILHYRADTAQGVVEEVLWQGDESYTHVHPGPDEDFARAIREGHAPQTSLERALIVQQITDAIYTSAAQGSAVNIDA